MRAHAGEGGLIAIAADGSVAYGFDTSHLAVGWTDGAAVVADVLSEAGVTVIP